jgi:dynein light intermediate chain
MATITAAAAATGTARATLVKLDPPVPPSQVRKPRALKLKSSKAANTAGAVGPQKESDPRRTIPPLDDILNAILPPEPVVDATSGETLLRCVSAVPATRLDCVRLQEALDEQLLARQAREAGVCPVRSELYTQTFDELIRQVTLECPERGLLLLRIRDDLHGTQSAHRMLYHTSIAFGSRKALTASNGIADLKAHVTKLEADRLALEIQVLELQAKCERIENEAQTRRAVEEKRHAEEVNFYRKTNHQLASQVKTETDRANTKK